jgi:hypothetical protein
VLLAWWAIALVGLGGGIVASLLLERNSLVRPAVRNEDGGRRLELGFASNLLLGVAAAFLPSLLGVSELTQQQQLGIVFVAATGGASFINTFTQKNQTEILAAQVRALELALDNPLRRLEVAGSPGRGAALELVQAIKKARSVAEVHRLGAELVRVIAAQPANLPGNPG